MTHQRVIHKQLVRLDNVEGLLHQVLVVPIDALVVDIQWDPVDPIGVGLWYQIYAPVKGDQPRDNKHWNIRVVRTGEVYPENATHLATVVRNETVWHLLDLDGGGVEWAPCCVSNT